MEKRVTLYGFLVVLAVGWNASLCIAESRKITEAEKNFCAEAYHKYCTSTGWRAPRFGTAWTATAEPYHTTASRHSSTRVRSLGVRWNVARKPVSEIGGRYPTKKTSFRRVNSAAVGRTLRIHVGDCPRSTSISGHTNDPELKRQLRRRLFILAENSDLEDLDGLQRSVLEAFARGVDY